MFITFNLWEVRIRATVNNNLIQDIKYFSWHCFSISKNLTVETHSKSYINTIDGVVPVDELPKVFLIIFKLNQMNNK